MYKIPCYFFWIFKNVSLYFLGYWLATAAPKILISKSSMVGSIGVISQSLGFHEVIQKLGIESRVYTAGKSKAFNNPLLPQKVCHT